MYLNINFIKYNNFFQSLNPILFVISISNISFLHVPKFTCRTSSSHGKIAHRMVNFDIYVLFHLLKIVIKFLKVNLMLAIFFPFPVFNFFYSFSTKLISSVLFLSKLKYAKDLYSLIYILFFVFSLILDEF